MADERKIFPVETVLELISGKEGANVEEIASFMLDRAVQNPACAKAVSPLAFAWLCRWFPRAMDLEWSEDQSWQSYLTKGKAMLGDSVSVAPMTGRIKALSDQLLDDLSDTYASLQRQTDAAMLLEKKVAQFASLKADLDKSHKQCDQLENQIKSLKADLGQALRTAAQYQGKMAVDEEELGKAIKDAIKDALKGVSIGAPVTQDQAAAEQTTVVEENANEDEFGFGASQKSDDEFGF